VTLTLVVSAAGGGVGHVKGDGKYAGRMLQQGHISGKHHTN
jgi:hypothetical protein